MAWPEDLPWDEAQAVTAEVPTVVENVDDDLERELAFYNQVGSEYHDDVHHLLLWRIVTSCRSPDQRPQGRSAYARN